MSLLLRRLASPDARRDAPYLSLIKRRLALRGVGFEEGRCNRRLAHPPSPHGSGQGRESFVASVLENLLPVVSSSCAEPSLSNDACFRGLHPQCFQLGIDRPLAVRRHIDLPW